VPVALNEHESTNFGLGDIMSLSPSTMSNGLASTSKLTLDGLSKEMGAMVKENKNATTANDAALGGGLVTCTRGTLGDRFASLQLTPLERIALTANGNLQRIYSSYYDAPVHVSVERSEARTATSSEDESISESSKSRTWDRVVHLSVFSQLFCTAESTIVVHDDHCLELLQSGRVGIGQLFRHLDRLPTFTLLDAGRSPNSHNGSLWRVYTLDCQELSCHIRETFCPDSWSLSPLLPSPTEDSNDDFLPQ
jgi:chorismate-pyruvate lyase